MVIYAAAETIDAESDAGRDGAVGDSEGPYVADGTSTAGSIGVERAALHHCRPAIEDAAAAEVAARIETECGAGDYQRATIGDATAVAAGVREKRAILHRHPAKIEGASTREIVAGGVGAHRALGHGQRAAVEDAATIITAIAADSACKQMELACVVNAAGIVHAMVVVHNRVCR